MSIPVELLTFGVGIDTSSAEAGLASLGASGEEVAAGLEDRLTGASEGMKELGKRSSSASRGIQGLASVISLVDPRLGQVVRSVGTLARGLSVLRLGLGPAAVAVAAVTGALALYQHEQRKAAEEAEAAAERIKNLTTALEDQHTIAVDLQTQIDLVNGSTDRFTLQYEQQRERIITAGEAVISALDDEIAAQEEKIRIQEEERRVSLEQQAVVKGLRSELEDLNQERLDAIDAMDSQLIAAEALADFRREEQEERERQRELEKQRAEAERDRQQRQREQESLLRELAKIERDSTLASLEGEERINFLLDEKIARLEEIARLTGADVTQARALAEMDAEMQLEALREEQFQQFLARQEEIRAQDAATTAEQLANQQEIRDSIVSTLRSAEDLYGSIASLVGEIAKANAGDDEAAQERAERLNKGFQIAGSVFRGLVGIVGGLLTGNVLGALTAGFGAASQVVGIASAHQGAQLAPDEQADPRGFVRLAGERDNGAGQVLSPEASRRMERGEAMGARVVPVPVYQHFGVFFPDYIQGVGTPLQNEINRTRDTGRSGY